eukprot:scaffold122858_cov33-Tisochrysis_lutea.AAC.2
MAVDEEMRGNCGCPRVGMADGSGTQPPHPGKSPQAKVEPSSVTAVVVLAVALTRATEQCASASTCFGRSSSSMSSPWQPHVP